MIKTIETMKKYLEKTLTMYHYDTIMIQFHNRRGPAEPGKTETRGGKMAKGIKIDRMLVVDRVGYACIGCMAWETPYVVFAEPGAPGEWYKWHSDNAEYAALELRKGMEVHVSAFAYDRALRRVRVLTETSKYGMGGR